MTLGARILAGIALLFFLLAGTALALKVQPLFPDDAIQIVYGEHEEFHADGRAFHRMRNRDLYVLYLPQAAPGYRWWTIDLRGPSIAGSRPARSIGRWRYALRGDLSGPRIGSGNADAWNWHFEQDRVSFAHRTFTCSVRLPSGR